MTTSIEQQLRHYFLANGGIIINKCSVKIGLCEGDVFYLLFTLTEDREEDYQYELYDEVKGMKQFMNAFSIHCLQDLHNIKRSDLWLRWLAEKAEVIFTNADGKRICFRLFRGKTMTYSIDFHYYDEVMKVMNMTAHFKNYIREKWEELEELSSKKG